VTALTARARRRIGMNDRIDLLKIDIEDAADAVLGDCEGALDRVAAIVMDLHDFDPAVRQTPRVLERLTRLGFCYSLSDLTSLTWRRPASAALAPFPGTAAAGCMTVRAWRSA